MFFFQFLGHKSETIAAFIETHGIPEKKQIVEKLPYSDALHFTRKFSVEYEIRERALKLEIWDSLFEAGDDEEGSSKKIKTA